MPKIESITIELVDDYDEEWTVGLFAKAEVSYKVNEYKRLETFTSSGLWGLDVYDNEYHTIVAIEELKELKEHLKAFNVDVINFKELGNKTIKEMV